MGLDATALLRPGLLAGRAIALAAASGPFGSATAQACAALGAETVELPLEPLDEAHVEESLAAATDPRRGLDALVVDAAAPFAEPPGPGLAALRAALDGSWLVTRAVANAHFIPEERGGRILLLAPGPEAGEYAGATRDGLENLARTLSIEWSRYGIRIVAVTPGHETTGDEVAALAAFLLSPGGDYYSGCRFDLGVTQVR